MNMPSLNSAHVLFREWLLPRKPLSGLQIKWAGVLRTDHDHLVAESRDEVRFQVANQMYLWEEGKRLVFDETWNPEAWHDTHGYRVVFTSDSERPRRRRWQWLNLFIAKFARR